MQIGAKLEEISTNKNYYERENRKLSLYISNNCSFGDMNKPVNKTKEKLFVYNTSGLLTIINSKI